MKALLFDFGGVFLNSPFEAVDHVAEQMQIDSQQLRLIIFGEYERDSEHPWHQLERGEITLEACREAIINIGSAQNLHIDIFDVFACFSDIQRYNNNLLLQQLPLWKQRGYKLAMVTNNIKEFDHWRDMFPFAVDDVFDVIADSCYLGMRKPSSGIFHHTLNALNVEANAALFVDDYPANVEAAKRLGIDAFCLTAMDEKTVQGFIDWVENRLTEGQ